MKLKPTILAAALSLATTAFAGETQQTFNAADMQQLFGQKSGSTQLVTLSQQEMKETVGAAVSQPPDYWENGMPKWNEYNESRQIIFEDRPAGWWGTPTQKTPNTAQKAPQPVQKVPVAVLGSGLGYVAPAGTPTVLGSGLGYAAFGTAVLR